YWPVSRPWPIHEQHPAVFLGQLCFADSRDLAGDLPGDVLLIFGSCTSESRFFSGDAIPMWSWQTLTDEPLVEEMPTSNAAILPCSGDLVRASDTVRHDVSALMRRGSMAWRRIVSPSSWPIPGRRHSIGAMLNPAYYRHQLAAASARLYGTKIGGLPPASDGEPGVDGFIGILASVLPARAGGSLRNEGKAHRETHGGGLFNIDDGGAFFFAVNDSGETTCGVDSGE
ncbi:MAG: hypothetical protein KDA25_02120, partial [Phycisphaerales bacterium]|nr:hypothetical protein [Phycisphaerales bacterium]